MNMKKFIYILSLVFVSSSGLFGQETLLNNVPRLGDHYFVPVSAFPAPFTNSHFGLNLGLAQSRDFENVILEIDGEPIIGLKGSLLFADLNFDYQQRVKEWMAFYMSAGLTARLGTEVHSILTQGLNTVSYFRMGWLIKILKKERYMLSGHVQINNYGATFINIKDFIDDILKDSTVSSITRNVPILNGSIGLRYAYAINEIVGIKAHGEIGYGESFERGASDFIYQFGALIDANLATKTKVPMGFALFFSATTVPDLVQVRDRTASNSGLKISYTGGPHFNLGLELANIRVPVPDVEEKINSAAVLITTKYFFNGDR